MSEHGIIKNISLRAGRTATSGEMSFDLGGLTLFIGPNNSGKSRLLTEILHFCYHAQLPSDAAVLKSLSFGKIFDGASALAELQASMREPNRQEQHLGQGIKVLDSPRGTMGITPEMLVPTLINPSSNYHQFTMWLSRYVLLLTGGNRITLVNPQPAGDLQNKPTTTMQRLFKSDDKRKEIRGIVYRAFGRFLVIDPTSPGQLRIRLSDISPVDDDAERSLSDRAIKFFGEADLIENSSDGVKAFIGILIEIIAGDPRVILIDEPEAFLHPGLAFQLGLEISKLALNTNKNIIVSTHSSSFLMGCLTSGSPIDIVRLTYKSRVATSRLLPGQRVSTLMRNPLLRSSGVLSALFYEAVIVTESDSDRAFYQEVNERLLRFKPDWGIPNCLFINAQNKQTVRTIVGPLRDLGIPAAGIVDVDVFKDGGVNWTKLLEATFIPQLSHASLGLMRSAIEAALISTGKNMKRDGGISVLSGSDQQAASDIIEQLDNYGLFIVPGGELECWLPHLGATGHGPGWLIKMFELIGDNPESANYIKPQDDDVWAFMSKLRTWLLNPRRKGIPD